MTGLSLVEFRSAETVAMLSKFKTDLEREDFSMDRLAGTVSVTVPVKVSLALIFKVTGEGSPVPIKAGPVLLMIKGRLSRTSIV